MTLIIEGYTLNFLSYFLCLLTYITYIRDFMRMLSPFYLSSNGFISPLKAIMLRLL